MNRTDRLHAIAEELRRAGAAGRTSAQLAARFETSTRTIKRDVAALQQAGHPIWATGGPGGGYVFDARGTLPPINFTAGEAVAVALALGNRPDLPFAVDGRSALAKVLEAMPATQRDRAERLGGKVWVRHRPIPRTEVTRVLEDALANATVVVIDYVSRDGNHTRRREVDPIYLGISEDAWYLFAWDRGRAAGRTFRVDRILAAVTTGTPAESHDFEETFGHSPPDDVAPVL
jgi:predicted DNA-binding transcriptional regulator YafY